MILVCIIIVIILIIRACSSSSSTIKIVVSMTTIPERIESGTIKKTIDSILKQSYPIVCFYINIPYQTSKGKLYPEDKITELKQQYPSVVFNRVDKDLGPIIKLIPTLNFIDADEWIVLVDDDTSYYPNMITKLVESGYDAVGYAGRLYDMNFIDSSTIYKDTRCALLETFAGVLYKNQTFNTFIEYYKENENVCTFQDDIMIGYYLEKMNIKRHVLLSEAEYYHDASGTPELRTDNLGGKNNNQKCYDKLFNKNKAY
jgi:hypothetical protein